MNKFEEMKRNYNKKVVPELKAKIEKKIEKPKQPSILTPKIENDPYGDWF